MRSIRLPSLERWLARADMETVAAEGPDGWLAEAYALASPAPIAAIALAGEGPARDGAWLRADPVHLRVDHDALMLHDASILELRKDEAAALVGALQRHFREDGFEFQAPAPDRWYLRVPEGDLPSTTPLWKAFGRNVFGLLPEGSGRVNWRAAFTEAQMTLGAHEVNEVRAREGKLPVNSVWLWGGGSKPAQVARRYALVHANAAFARGLGSLSAAEVRALPPGIAAIDLVGEGESALVVIDSLRGSLHRADERAWIAEALALDASWFENLAGALARFGEVRIVLPFERGTRVARVNAAARWRVFRPRRPLATHA
jgi:hypothetical protein